MNELDLIRIALIFKVVIKLFLHKKLTKGNKIDRRQCDLFI
jgi:hypothetical protein